MNKIDRHNYEEYFILYVDKELSSKDSRMVELFVQKNPDLADELDLLQQFKLAPDTNISYTGKQELFRSEEATTINAENRHEYFSLYIDEELTPSQKAATEKFAAQNPSFQKELLLLQQTKLPVEAIICPDKKSLYKKEEKVRRIIPIWWRVAAGILLTVGLGITLLLTNKKKPETTEGTIAVTPAKQIKKEVEQATAIQKEKKEEPLQAIPTIKTNEVQQSVAVVSTENKLLKASTYIPNHEKKQKEIITTIPQNKAPIIVNHKQENNNLPQPEYRPSIDKEEKQKGIAKNEVPDKVKTDPNNSLTTVAVTKKEDAPLDIITTAFVEEENTGKKSKGRGFFRKIARTFEKRTNIDPTDGDGRLLVAGFAFKTR
jgi:hypothetical protein